MNNFENKDARKKNLKTFSGTLTGGHYKGNT